MTATNWQSVAIRTSTFAVYLYVLGEAKQFTRLVFAQKNHAESEAFWSFHLNFRLYSFGH